MSRQTEPLPQIFERIYGEPPEILSEAPGRVNLIGEHTDYNDGFVLPIAIDRTVAVAASPRDDLTVRAYSVDYDQSDEFPVDRVRRFAGSRGWRDYVRGAAWALQDSHIALRGADIAISGDVPRGAGLSSSAAIEVAVAGALTAASDVAVDDRRLALLCQKAETIFAGVQCGIMDQFASTLGIKGHALLIDCRSLDARPVPLPEGYSVVVIDSRVRRELGATAYNRRRDECAEAAALLGVPALRDADMAMLESSREKIPEALYRRARHVIAENARVMETVRALEAGDPETVGALMYESHESLHSDFEVSTPELDFLVDTAGRVPGVVGARLTGAGFGGCTVNLVADQSVDSLATAVADRSACRSGEAPEVIVCHPADGLRISRV